MLVLGSGGVNVHGETGMYLVVSISTGMLWVSVVEAYSTESCSVCGDGGSGGCGAGERRYVL